MVTTQTYATHTVEQRIYYNLALIKRLKPMLVMFEDGQKKTVPKHAGGFASGQIQWRKVSALSLATTPLTEGTTPSGSTLTTSEVTTYLRQYGDWLQNSDILITAGIDPMMEEIVDVLGEQAGQTIHSLIISELKNNTTVQIVNGKAARTDLVSTDVMTAWEAKKAVRTLEVNKVPRFRDKSYHALIGPYGKFDLSNDPDYTDFSKNWGGIAKDGGPDLINYYVGTVNGAMFKESTEAPSYTGPVTYGTLIYGPDWYGTVDFEAQAVGNVDAETNMGIAVMVVPTEQATKDDPLAQRGTAGWKVAFAAKILDNARAVLIHHGATG